MEMKDFRQDQASNVRAVALVGIVPSRWQPRAPVFDAPKLLELAKSIKDNGLINLPWVFETPTPDGESAHFELVAGERRVRALVALAWSRTGEIKLDEAVIKLAEVGLGGLPKKVIKALQAETITAHVVPSGDLLWLHRVAVVENIEREGLAPLEEADALAALQEHTQWSQREMAKHIGKSQAYVAQRLSLRAAAQGSPALAEAVNTRVLNATHARAIASVPAALQPAFTAWATKAVEKGDSAATTRQVAERARQLTAFVGPERYRPQAEMEYTAEQRNRLALLSWAVEHADLAAQAEALIALADYGYNHDNFLGAKVSKLVEGRYWIGIVLTALGYGCNEMTIWNKCAPEVGRVCSTCVLGQTMVEVDSDPGIDPYCARWQDPNLTTCLHFIGLGEPVEIDAGIETEWFESVNAPLNERGNFNSVDAYVASYPRACEAQRADVAEMKQAETHGFLDDIQAFMDWQVTLPPDVTPKVTPGWDFYGCFCNLCAHWSENREGAMRCAFAEKPFKAQYEQGNRAPHFGVLVMKDRRLLPRCEQFAYRELPAIWKVPGVQFGDPALPLRWLRLILESVPHGLYNALGAVHWGAMRWLPYNRPADKNDLDRLIKYVGKNWAELGGDGAMATLLDVAVFESRFAGNPNHAVNHGFEWFNPVTHTIQAFAAVRFEDVLRGNRLSYDYPKDYPQPWVK